MYPWRGPYVHLFDNPSGTYLGLHGMRDIRDIIFGMISRYAPISFCIETHHAVLYSGNGQLFVISNAQSIAIPPPDATEGYTIIPGTTELHSVVANTDGIRIGVAYIVCDIATDTNSWMIYYYQLSAATLSAAEPQLSAAEYVERKLHRYLMIGPAHMLHIAARLQVPSKCNVRFDSDSNRYSLINGVILRG